MSIMSKTMKKIVTVLLMVVFTVLAAGCENQDEKFKRLESELYDVGKWDVSYDKAVETLDEKLLKEAAEEYSQKSSKLTKELVATAKGNAEYQRIADELQQGYANKSKKFKTFNYETLRRAKFERLKKKINTLQGNFIAKQEKYFASQDRVAYEKMVQEYITNADPIVAELNTLASGDKTLTYRLESINLQHQNNKAAIKNDKFGKYIESRKPKVFKCVGEEKYRNQPW